MKRLRIGDTVRILPSEAYLSTEYDLAYIGHLATVIDVIPEQTGTLYAVQCISPMEYTITMAVRRELLFISRPVKPRTGLRVGDWVRVLPRVRRGLVLANAGSVGRVTWTNENGAMVTFPAGGFDLYYFSELLRVHGDGSERP